ncbi:hypothetical protein CHO01_29030 [Cellulomonas hominis]|uniref:Uncharacterized protein n=1 Tax=Cellulomonas hominis TaxID=156981 RepID=A0A511FHG8_9CELL|nr:hypothetical protein [Cellulomonas hominis]MBB5474748.1 hypothetical protein [Cellulomonas hominis]NKY05404.1 hypothetical protein [Cellulomonas hominis]GEL47787.1 hypothetical protein CHO01_29030 [Cellulomonas hominis]
MSCPQDSPDADGATVEAPGPACGWCLVGDCDHHRPAGSGWSCMCSHANRRPQPAATGDDVTESLFSTDDNVEEP